jgi:gas vesicle protein
MSSKIAAIFAIAFVLVAAPLACGGEDENQQVEEAKEQAKEQVQEQVQEAKEQAQEAKEQAQEAKEQVQEAKEQVQEAEGEKAKAPKYEDLPEEVKAKMPEGAKQKMQ